MEVTVLLVFVVIMITIFCLSFSVDHYEIEELAHDVCQKKCLNQGLGYQRCSNSEVLGKCISKMKGLVGNPPEDTTLNPVE
jgi:protoheme ferro-lyase